MKFRKAIATVMAATMVLSFVGCSSSASSEAAAPAADAPAATEEAAPAEAAPAADAPATTLTVCGTNGLGDTQSMAHQELADRLNAMGGWEVNAMVSSEMGSTDDVLEQAIAGMGVIAASDPARIAAYVPEIGILMMPYLFDSYDQLDSLMDTELYKGWTADLKDQGLVLLTNNCLTGWRNWVTNTPITEPADLSGIKIRTMGSPIALNSVNAMGAIATPLDQNEAYNGISTGVIDGGEWQLPTIYTLKLYEVADHISLSHHFLLTGSIVAGAAWYDGLSEQQQVELSETAVETYKDNQALVTQYEEEYLAEMQETYGVTVTEPNREAFKEATAYLYSDMDTTGGVDFDALRTELYAQLGM